MVSGRVIQEQKNYYVVNTEQGDIRATLKGVLKKNRTRICAGDRVDLEIINRDSAEGIIVRVHERTSLLSRPPLANLDQVFVVCAFRSPPLDLEALDRLLFSVHRHALRAILVFNKSDLVGPEDRHERDMIVEAYRTIGYPVLITSAAEGSGVADIAALGAGKVSAFAGLSGVGKSALLSRLFPGRTFAIGEVSRATGRGTHTTTTVSLLPLPDGGYIADTPGLSFVDLPLTPEEDVAAYFPELEQLIGQCRFNNCIHENEPGCKVRERAEQGVIKTWRVTHYLKIYHEMRERRRHYREKLSR